MKAHIVNRIVDVQNEIIKIINFMDTKKKTYCDTGKLKFCFEEYNDHDTDIDVFVLFYFILFYFFVHFILFDIFFRFVVSFLSFLLLSHKY